MEITTILRDTRERRPWEFRDCPVETADATLSTGDYTLAEFCRPNDGGAYEPRFAIERKTGEDFLTSITWERERFRRELTRADGWPEPLYVLVEEPWESFEHGHGAMARRDIHPGQVEGTLSTWTDRYNVAFRFVGTRRAGERFACCRLLSRRLHARSILEGEEAVTTKEYRALGRQLVELASRLRVDLNP